MRVAWLLLCGLVVGGCFNPSVRDCAVTCNASTPCPSGATCLLDGFCHESAEDSLCSVVDSDAGPLDGSDAAGACGNGVLQAEEGEQCDDENVDDGDGCSSTCKNEVGFVCVGQPSVCRPNPSVAGHLVITELLINSDAVGDLAGEWMEIHNPTSVDFDLQGMTVEDDNMPQLETFNVTTSLVLPAGGHLVFGVSTDMASNGGAPVDFAYGGSARFSNDPDGVVIRFGSVVIDEVGWVIPPVGASFSLSLDSYDSVSNDDTGNFCDGVGVFGDGDEGTPGLVNPDCP